MTNSYTTDHGVEEGFCARCMDYHPGSVSVHDIADVAVWSCLNCDWSVEPDDVPGDYEQAEQWLDEGRIAV